MTLIYNDWGDHRVGADILCYMNGYNDPRREKMFTTVTLVENGQEVQGYAGIRIGINVSSKATAVSAYSNMLITGTDPYLWMNAAEVTFLRAEYELRWGSTENARTFYEDAIRTVVRGAGCERCRRLHCRCPHTPAAYVDPIGRYSVSTPQSSVTIAWDDKATDIETNLEKDYHPEVDCHLPAGDRGVGRTPPDGLSAVASGGGECQRRHGGLVAWGAAPAVPGGGVHRESDAPPGGHCRSEQRIRQRRGRHAGNPRMVGPQKPSMTNAMKNHIESPICSAAWQSRRSLWGSRRMQRLDRNGGCRAAGPAPRRSGSGLLGGVYGRTERIQAEPAFPDLRPAP